MVLNYEVEPVKVGATDTYLVKVWSFSNDMKWEKLEALAKRNAVHAIIFRGFSSKNNVNGVNALAWNKPNLEQTHKEFFDSFFMAGGRYLEYADMVSVGIAAEDRIKTSNGYKIGLIVSIKQRALKDYLVTAGILESLGGRF